MIKPIALFAASAVLLSGCMTYDPYTGEEEVSKATTGAAIGAGVGAAAAYFANKDKDSRSRNKRILAAAGGGALVGGGIGYYMDQQESKLRKQLRGSGVSVVRNGDNIDLVMPGNITFKSGSANINAGFYDVLNSVGLVLEEFDKTLVVVSGHTDSTGSDSTNQRLSEQRASSVAGYLKGRKVLAERFEVMGFGEAHPIAGNNTAQGRELNRRVEITLMPIKKS